MEKFNEFLKSIENFVLVFQYTITANFLNPQIYLNSLATPMRKKRPVMTRRCISSVKKFHDRRVMENRSVCFDIISCYRDTEHRNSHSFHDWRWFLAISLHFNSRTITVELRLVEERCFPGDVRLLVVVDEILPIAILNYDRTLFS